MNNMNHKTRLETLPRGHLSHRLGTIIREARARMPSMTASRLSKMSKMSVPSITRIERGEALPGEDALDRICTALSLNKDEMQAILQDERNARSSQQRYVSISLPIEVIELAAKLKGQCSSSDYFAGLIMQSLERETAPSESSF